MSSVHFEFESLLEFISAGHKFNMLFNFLGETSFLEFFLLVLKIIGLNFNMGFEKKNLLNNDKSLNISTSHLKPSLTEKW